MNAVCILSQRGSFWERWDNIIFFLLMAYSSIAHPMFLKNPPLECLIVFLQELASRTYNQRFFKAALVSKSILYINRSYNHRKAISSDLFSTSCSKRLYSRENFYNVSARCVREDWCYALGVLTTSWHTDEALHNSQNKKKCIFHKS